jgi:anti-anti-sigma factor
MDWTLDTREVDGSLRVTPSGELDLVTAPLLAREILEAERSGDTPIVLDLDAVTFMDSSGLAAVLEAVQRSEEHGRGRLSIVASRGVVVRVLQLADLMDSLPLVAR